MRTTQIGNCNFVNGSCTSVTEGNIFKTQLFGQMKPHLILIAQLINIIVCTEKAVNLPGVAVWCGLSSRGLIGSYFLEEIVTGQTYLQMLEIMISRLNDLFENENEVYFQQHGALPHFHVNVRNFLDHTFNQRCIGRRGSSMEFPPHLRL